MILNKKSITIIRKFKDVHQNYKKELIEKHLGSRHVLVKEFYRRMYCWSEIVGYGTWRPFFFDVVNQINSAWKIELSSVHIEDNENLESYCDSLGITFTDKWLLSYSLNWTEHFEFIHAEYKGIPNPFEVLLVLLDKGGWHFSHTSASSIRCGTFEISPTPKEKFLTKEPILILDDDILEKFDDLFQKDPFNEVFR